MNNLFKDFQYSFRTLLKRPGFTFTSVITLALAIGATTAIFSVVNAVLLRPLPFADPDRLVMLWQDASFAGFPRNTPSAAEYNDWKNQNTVFEGIAAQDNRSFNLTGDGEPEKVDAFGVTANFFPLLGVKPVLGRTFLPEEDKPQATNVVVISNSLWQKRYGGDQNIIGRSLLLSGQKYTVVGVMPGNFQFSDSKIGMWVPIAFTAEQLASYGRHYLTVFGRMKPGVSLAQADAEIHTLQRRVAEAHPKEAGKTSAYAISFNEQISGEMRRPLLVLLAAVGFVLLIACANVASLLLSRATSRRKEMALRTALGANRLQIVRQLLIESLLLSSFGLLLGLAFAWWSFGFLQKLIPDGLLLSSHLTLDPLVLLFSFVLMLVTAMLFGMVPALQASKLDLNEALKQGGGRTGLNAGGNRLRSALVVAEVALALVLLVGAGLLIKTFLNLQNQYAALRADKVLTLRTVLPRNKYPEHSQRVNFYKQVLERVSALPGVVSAGYVTGVPLSMKGGTNGFWIEGRTVDQALASGDTFDANHRQVSPDYFKTMGIAIREGRAFTNADNEQNVRVAIINETMAQQYWRGENAIGKRMKFGGPGEDAPWITVVGISADVRQMGIDKPVKAEMYLPYEQNNGMGFYAPRDLAIRTKVDPLSMVGSVRNEIHQVDPDQPISNIRTMDTVLGEETAARRLGMTLLTVFAAVALLLASLGIYGVLAYFVVQHTQEIGVRMALGAQRVKIVELVLKKGMLLVWLGIAIGLAGAIALTRLMASLLYGVSATDPLTYVAISALLTLVAFAACYIPARRATKVDPLVALRYE